MPRPRTIAPPGAPQAPRVGFCGYCGKVLEPQARPRGSPRKYCNRKHRRLAYNVRCHNATAIGRGDPVPLAALLELVRRGATTWELATLVGLRFGARLHELRSGRLDQVRHQIRRSPIVGSSGFLYRLEE